VSSVHKKTTKDIIKLLSIKDIVLLKRVLDNEKVYFILKKWNATPNCGWKSKDKLLSLVGDFS